MANLLFLDSFDHYASDGTISQGPRKWTTFPPTIGIAPGRTGSGIQIFGVAVPTKTLNATYPTLTAGVAQRMNGFSNAIIAFSNALGGPTVQLDHVGDGRLQIKLQYGTTVYSPPSTFVLSINTWYYFEFSCTMSGDSSSTTLSASANINEAAVLSFSYTYSSPIGPSGFATVALGAPGGGNNAIADDFYCTDGEFLGDIKVGVLYPNAVGASSGWTPNIAGSPNFLNVLEHPADDDATYVSANATGLKDLYNLDNIPAGFAGNIRGVQALWLVKKSDVGAAAVKGVWKSGTTELVQTSGHNFIAPDGYHPSNADYSYDIEPERKSLFTSADWGISEINGLQLGITRTV